MEFELSSIDAAVEQLDWAIRLFLDHQAYVPAITLAAAAEELLGKAIGRDRAAHSLLKEKLAPEYSLSESDVSDHHLNKLKNWLKHGGDLPGAMTNLGIHDCTQPSQGPRFWAWMAENAAGRVTPATRP